MHDFSFDHHSFLIVDDAEIDRLIITNLVSTLGHVDVFTASNGLEAIEKLQSEASNVDCVLSDFDMPVMHGLQLLKAIRMGYRNMRYDLPFVMLTGHNEVSLVSVAIVLDIDAFILKPANKEILQMRLREVLQDRNSSSRLTYLPADYACINIEKEIGNIGVPKSIVDLNQKMIRKMVQDNNSQRLDHRISENDVTAGPTDRPKEPVRMECRFEDIPPNSVLLEDLKTVSGRLLYPKDMLLTQKILKQIRSLLEADEKIQTAKIETIPQLPSKTLVESVSL